MTVVEGMIPVEGGRVWCQSAGDPARPALLLLHGGPGGNSEDLSPLMALADDGYRVVRFDQLGSWRSDQPDDPSLWQVERFVGEVEAVRQALGLGRVHLLGQSWGAFLALEYALHHQRHLRSLILASGAASTAECIAGMNRWREQLPAATQATMARHEATGDYHHPDYKAAVDELLRRHFCRVSPLPTPLADAIAHVSGAVYGAMWGPNEFTCTGTLRSFDRSDRLGEIAVPTLITVGRWDEVHPSCAETLHRGIPGSRLVLFEESAHVAHLEEAERYRATLRSFLAEADGAAVGAASEGRR